MRLRLAWALLALMAAATFYGFIHNQLYHDHTWNRSAVPRLIGFGAVFALGAGLVLWRIPQRLPHVAAAFVLVYTIWWAGFAAPLAVLYFLGSCYFLGRLIARQADAMTAILLGASVWIF